MSDDKYDLMARYYDASYAVKSELQDVQFWVDEAKASGGPVLEIACGTGRVLLPIAREGIRIDGVDRSRAMLEQLRAKLTDDLPVEVFEGDMRTLDLARRYALVTIPFRPLQHLYTQEDQLAALRAARRHLDEGGRLIFDLFDPRPDRVMGGIGEEAPDLRWTEGDVEIVRIFRKDGVDKHAQRFWGQFRWEHRRGEQLIETHTEDFEMGWYTQREILLLLRLAGLEPVAQYGDFDRRPLGEGSQMIFVSRAAASD